MKRAALVLCVSFLFGACSRTAPPQQAPALPPMDDPSILESTSSNPTSPPAQPIIHIQGSDGNPEALIRDGGKSLSFPQGGVIELQWQEPVSFDRILLEGLGDSACVRILSQDTLLYTQDGMENSHWCYTGEQTASRLTVELIGANQTLQKISFSTSSKPAPRVAAYLPISSFRPKMLQDGSLEGLQELIVNTGCYWNSDGSLQYSQELVDAMLSIRKAYPDLKIWCTINPQGKLVRDGAAGASISSPEQRRSLIEHILSFCLENEIAGVDIDWEFPQKNEWDAFSLLLEELSSALHSRSISLSAAFYPQDIRLSSNARQALSCVRVMAYDQFDERGYHSTYLTAQQSIAYFEKLGFSPSQLCLGIPAYGRPTDRRAQWPTYAQAAANLQEDQNLLDHVFYNGPQLVQDKTILSEEEQLYGIFLYHLGCDIPGLDERSLMEAIREITNR